MNLKISLGDTNTMYITTIATRIDVILKRERSNDFFNNSHLITVRKRSCGKVMFSQPRVKNSVHGGGVHPLGRHTLKADTLLGQTPTR